MKRVLLLAALLATVASAEEKPKAWKPGASSPAVVSPETVYTAPADRPMAFGPGVTRSLDLMYQPSVPDSILPLVPLYREIDTDEVLSTYIGSLRQDLPTRPWSVILPNQKVHAHVDGLEGQSHVAIMIMVPWFGDILPLPATEATLVVKMDDGPETKWKLQLAPGPNLYIPSQRPLPVSNPTMMVLPLPAGAHRLQMQLKDLRAQYAFLELGQPVLTPPAIVHAR